MKFTLITKNGKVIAFNVKAAAEQFQLAYGGIIIANNILETEKVCQVA